MIMERLVIKDNRGSFTRLFDMSEFHKAGMMNPILQINHACTKIKGTVKGLHFQNPPHSELKVVTCLRGEVFDVAVDLRRGSKTFLSWHGEYLSEFNNKTLVIPRGFAHGFQAMTNDCELLYFHDANYDPGSEGGFHVEDKRIGIKWPLPISVMSDRDMNLASIHPGFEGMEP